MILGKEVEATCVDLDFEGNGVAKYDNFPFFINGPLVDEKIVFKIDKINKSFGLGTLKEIKETSPFRVIPACSSFDKCGGCNLMHLEYSKQLEYKKHIVKDTLKRVGKVDVEVNDTIGMDKPYNYRNNVQIPFGFDGKTNAGFYSPKSHNVVDCPKCLIANSLVEKIIEYIKQLCIRYRITIYNEKNKKGSLRHVVLRNNGKQDFMVVFVTATTYFNNKEEIVSDLKKRFKNIVSIYHNINESESSLVFGKNFTLLDGQASLVDVIEGLKFEISPNSFFQVNTIQTKKLYNQAIEYASISANDIVVDAYCGIGTISLLAAKKAKKVYGIEIVEEAIKNALANLERNNMENVSFLCGPSEKLIKDIRGKVDIVIMDPPRKGCDENFLRAIVAKEIKRIVYVSCNVRTLARDLNYLESNGYKAIEVTPVDMFPQTTHVESVTLLELKK